MQNQSYLYDLVGNVTQRQNNALGLSESFCYDNVYRLDHSTLTGVCTGSTNLKMTYDAMGNITSRDDIASGAMWTYSTTHKHQALQAGDVGHTYTYDANGNAITRNGYAVGWTSYNLPNSISAGGESSTFTYGPNHEKWTQFHTGSAGATDTTTYYGRLLETVVTSSGTDWRHYIYAGNEPVAIYSRTSGGINTLRYTLEDHLGSINVVTDTAGTSLFTASFAAFGTRRNSLTWNGTPPQSDLDILGITRRGFTYQTMVMNVVHLNGRVLDTITGRFLSADPYVTEPGNTQNFDRYGYVYNNPLSHIDPSGFGAIYTCHLEEYPTYTEEPNPNYVAGSNVAPTMGHISSTYREACYTIYVPDYVPDAGPLPLPRSGGPGSGSGLAQGNQPCRLALGGRLAKALQGVANVALGGAKTYGFAMEGIGAVLGTPATEGMSLTTIPAVAYGIVSSQGQVGSGLGQLYSAVTNNTSLGGRMEQAGDIMSGPVAGVGTLIYTGDIEAAQRSANIESLFTAGSGLINSKTATELAQSTADEILALFGLAGEQGCGSH